MPVYPDGLYVKELEWNRLIGAFPTSYTVLKIDDTYYAESLIPDGTDYNSDDPATAIQAAINGTSKGLVSLKSDGTIWDITSAIDMKRHVSVEGVGFGVGGADVSQPTTLRIDGTSNRIFQFVGGSGDWLGCSIRNLKFMHDGSSPGLPMYIKNGNHLLLENLEFYSAPTINYSDAALSIEGGENYWLRNVYVHDTPKTAILLTSVGSLRAENVILNGCCASDPGAGFRNGADLLISGGDNIVWKNGQFGENQYGHGIRGYDLTQCKIGPNNQFLDIGKGLTDTFSCIRLEASGAGNLIDVTIQNNHFEQDWAGVHAAKAKYAIDISNSNSSDVTVTPDNIYVNPASFASGVINDAGTRTVLPKVIVPFVDGTACEDSGWDIDLGGEYARAFAYLPYGISEIVRIKIYARSMVLEADAMRLEVVMNAGSSDEAYNTRPISVIDKPSTTTDFAADDIIYWILASTDDADIGDLISADSLEIKVLHEAAGGDDCATDARFRTVEIQYV